MAPRLSPAPASGDTVTPKCVGFTGARHLDGAPHDRLAGLQAFGHHGRQRRRRRERLEVVRADALRGQAEQPAPGRIENLHPPARIDDEKAGHQAVGNLAAQLIGRGGAGAHRLLLRLQLADRLLQRGRQQHGVRAVLAQVPLGVARAGDDPQQREGQHADEHRDHRGEPDERVAKLRHDARPAHVRYARIACS